MGLRVKIKGMNAEETYDCGYLTFLAYRKKVAYAYNEEFGSLYEKSELTEDEIKRWNEICNDDLDIFLNHSDYEGKFTPQECRKIYHAMKDLKVEMQGHNYGIMKPYDMHEQWMNMFKYCYQKKVNMYFR